MRFKSFCFLLLIVTTFFSCKKDQAPLFELDIFFELDIPAGLNTLESHFFIIEDVPTFALNALASNNLNISDISHANAITATLETRFSDLNLDFIENIGVHVLDENDFSMRDEAFYIFNDFVQFGDKIEIQMIPTLLDLKNDLLKETVDLEFKINLRSFLPQELDARVNMKFHVFPTE